jgi:hypothetical protein
MCQLITDVWFVKDINMAVKKIAAISTSPLYYYEFSFDGPFGIIKRIWGAETLPGKFPFFGKQTTRGKLRNLKKYSGGNSLVNQVLHHLLQRVLVTNKWLHGNYG